VPNFKLSITMVRAIDAIRAAGGEAHPEQGGWWHGSSDLATPRLETATDDWRGRWPVASQTIMSLADRGLLERLSGTGNRTYSAYRLTALAEGVTETVLAPGCASS